MNKNDEDKFVIILGCLLLFSVQILGNMIVIALPSITETLKLSMDASNAVTLVYLVLVISLILPFGKFISKYGVGKYLKIGIILGIISLFICAIAPNYLIFIIGRILQGISTALICCAINLTLSLQLSSETFGRGIGIVLSLGYGGLTLSYLFSGFITYYLSWRVLFLSLIPFYIIALYILIKLNKEWFSESHIKIDYKGSIIYFIFMILLSTSLSYLDDKGILLLPISFILLIVLVVVEKNTEYPLYNLKLLRNPDYVIGNYASFVVFFITFITIYILNFYLQYHEDYDPSVTGLFLLPAAISMIVVAHFAGKLTVKYDVRLLSALGCVILIFATYIILLMDFIPTYYIFLACIVLGIAEGFFLASNNRHVVLTINREHFIDSSTFLFTNRELGKTISLALYFLISGLVFGDTGTYEGNLLHLVMTGEMMMRISMVLTVSVIILLIAVWYKNKRNSKKLESK